jgi:hypothetical protein
MLTQRPGLRAATTGEPEDAIVTDFVALLDLLDDQAAQGRPGRTAHSPQAVCAVSGLRRLPSFAGPVYAAASLAGQAFREYPPGQLLIEPGFVPASSSPQLALGGDMEYVIWSETAKRVAALSPEAGRDEVIFAAGTIFRVLHAAPGPGRARFFLREVVTLGGGDPGPDGHLAQQDLNVLERLTAAALVRDGTSQDDRLPPRRDRLACVIGVDDSGAPFLVTRS